MKKTVISLAIIRRDGKEEVVDVLDYVEIGSRLVEVKDNTAQKPLFPEEEPPKP